MTIEMTNTPANKIMYWSRQVIAVRFIPIAAITLLHVVACFDGTGYAQEVPRVVAGGGQRELVQSAGYRPARHAISSSVNGANYIASESTPFNVPQAGISSPKSGFLARVEERQSQESDRTQNHPVARSEVEASGKTPLPPPKEGGSDSSKQGGTGGFLSMLFSLAIVVGLFFGCVWIYRKFSGNAAIASSKNDPLKILARKTVGPRHQLAVIEFGPKILLVSMQHGDARTLSEIEEPGEVSRWKEQVALEQPSSSGLLASWGVAAGQNSGAATRSGLEEKEPQAALARAGLNASPNPPKKSFRAMLQDGVASR
jgi:flagellar biogenesis protein FliO